LAGGGTTNQTTCTITGDLDWLSQAVPGGLPQTVCGAQLQFDTTDWIACPILESFPGGYVAAYDFSTDPTSTDFQYCNVPATDSRGVIVLVAALAALGAFILWPRRA
jgi:hypothetical protein